MLRSDRLAEARPMTRSLLEVHNGSSRHNPDSSPARLPWLARPQHLQGEHWSDISVMLGALSIVMFWMFGFGIVLGVCAIAAGIAANRHPAVEGSEPKSLEALLGFSPALSESPPAQSFSPRRSHTSDIRHKSGPTPGEDQLAGAGPDDG
ncbi:hypothetical protein WSS_A18444 [Rhodococcus opacus M213]|uniref:Uncharacterized protein n=1 Tax=Rhodococcus opacus M213 TaxID=1129896 RepID=K8XJY3_RHOOP|nr:hypothetical protein WSS_A18444 [Rhodococcus opacus M213]